MKDLSKIKKKNDTQSKDLIKTDLSQNYSDMKQRELETIKWMGKLSLSTDAYLQTIPKLS